MGVRLTKGGKSALLFVRQFIAPLPEYSSLVREFGFCHATLGFIFAGMEYQRQKLQNKSQYYRLCGIMFDEIKTTKVGQIDKKVDQLIGPGSQVGPCNQGRRNEIFLAKIFFFIALLKAKL